MSPGKPRKKYHPLILILEALRVSWGEQTRRFMMKSALKTWFPIIKSMLLTIALLDGRHLRNARMFMRLKDEFGLVEVEGRVQKREQ